MTAVPTTLPTAATDGDRRSARARIALLADPGSFIEQWAATTPAVITGTATVGGRPVALLAQDPEAAPAHGTLMVEKTVRLQEQALRMRCPAVYLLDRAPPGSANGRTIFAHPDGIGRTYLLHARMSGQVPQVALLFGGASSIKAFPPAMCDLTIMVERAALTLAPEAATRMLTGQTLTRDQLGGADVHCSITGIGDVLAAGDAEALAWARRYLACLPAHCGEAPPPAAPAPPDPDAGALADLIPADPSRPFPIQPVIRALVDAGSLLEVKARFAAELTCGLARLDGIAIGVVASNSAVRGGILHADSCDKAVRFIQLCDAYNLPLLYLADLPGFMVGQSSERAGIVRAAAKLFTANATATVPKIAVLVRKVHTAGLYAMCGPAFEPDAFLALPGTEMSVMGARLVDRNLQHAGEQQQRQLREEMLGHTDPDRLRREVIVDAVVPPGELRAAIAARLHRCLAGRRIDPRRRAAPIWPM